MSVSSDALMVFVEAATAGSFSAAARKLGKRQSTISEAIANLEIELGVMLFDRSQRLPRLTPAGQTLLAEAQKVLHASETLTRKASLLAAGKQINVTLAVSDLYPSDAFRRLLSAIDKHIPALEFECLIAEDDDIIASIQRGRAHIGLLAAQTAYPADVKSFTLSQPSEMVLIASPNHPLSQLPQVTTAHLSEYRELKIEPFERKERVPMTQAVSSNIVSSEQSWSTSHYMVLLEMVLLGYGWANVPKWLLDDFTPVRLCQLPVNGWPRQVAIDAVWSARHKVGSASAWILDLLRQDMPLS